MQHPDEGAIHTWLDGELSPDGAAELDAHVAECSECAVAVAEARGFIAGSSRIVSALDIVPGDVIPTAAPIATPRKRSWYGSTQFRAAAAVFFVAGASLLLFRDGREAKMATVMDSRVAESAPVEQAARALNGANQAKDETSAANAVESQLDRQGARSEKREANSTALAQTATGAGSATGATGVAKESAESNSRKFSDRPITGAPVATAKVAAPPPGPPRGPTALERMRADTSRTQPGKVIVTGVASTVDAVVAASPAPVAPLRVVRADTVGEKVRTTFDVSPGVEVTLTETRVADALAASTAQRQLAVPMSRRAPGGPSRAASAPIADAVRVDSVSWVSAVSGRSYVLSGRLTKEQLTVLRSRLPVSLR